MSRHARHKVLTITCLQEMLEVRLIEIKNLDKYPKIMMPWRRWHFRYSEQNLAGSRKSEAKYVVFYQYDRAPTLAAKATKI